MESIRRGFWVDAYNDLVKRHHGVGQHGFVTVDGIALIGRDSRGCR